MIGSSPANSHAVALVLDLETRHAEGRAAGRLVGEVARTLPSRYIFKKTDSTLRGPIGAELAALLEACTDRPLIYIPAYPLLGRTVRDGRLYVDGVPLEASAFARDPLFPVRTSLIREVTGNLGPRMRICDAETEADVRASVAAALEQSAVPLIAGPAGVVRYLAELLPLPRHRDSVAVRVTRALVLNGSAHPASLAQIASAKPPGWTVVGALTKDVIARERPDALIIFGGFTAHAVLQSLGVQTLIPLGELLPGVPVCRLGGRNLTLITKAGGYGGPNLLLEMHAALSQTW